MTDPKLLAEWRREGAGVWRATYVVEGYDEEFVIQMPGKLSRKFAATAGQIKVGQELRESVGIVHLQSLELET